MSSLDVDIDDFRAVGHGIMSLINVAVLFAILAVILSTQSQAPAVIKAAFGFVSWLVSQVVRPVTGGTNTPLTSTLSPAYASGNSGGAGSGQ